MWMRRILCDTILWNIELVVLIMSVNIMVDRMVVGKVIRSGAVAMINHVVGWLALIFNRVSWVLFYEYWAAFCAGNVATEVI